MESISFARNSRVVHCRLRRPEWRLNRSVDQTWGHILLGESLRMEGRCGCTTVGRLVDRD